MQYRPARAEEIEQLAQLCKQQLMDEGQQPNCNIDRELHAFFAQGMQDGTLVEWVAEENGALVATAAIIFYPFPPSFTNPGGIRGYLTNVYTSPAFRGRGIAGDLLRQLMAEAEKRGVPALMLSASAMGRPVYEKLGFIRDESWMNLRLD